MVFEWRAEAERRMRETGRPGMSEDEVREFCARYMPAYRTYLPGLYQRAAASSSAAAAAAAAAADADVPTAASAASIAGAAAYTTAVSTSATSTTATPAATVVDRYKDGERDGNGDVDRDMDRRRRSPTIVQEEGGRPGRDGREVEDRGSRGIEEALVIEVGRDRNPTL